jgi:hypothetical protein
MNEDMDWCSVVDCVSHTLLAALAATQPGRQWGLKMQVIHLDYFTVLRIRNVCPGNEYFSSGIPDPNFFHPGSASKNLSIFAQNCF